MDRLSPAYAVKLPIFEGPLDLLLHLIEREELDITTISLAQVTDQYLEYIRQIEERSATNLADFLVVATKLLLIKSRMLLPAPPVPQTDEEEEDVGEGLVRQLIEYKKFKQVAAQLAALQERGWRSYTRLGPVVVSSKSLDLNDVSLNGLALLVRQALDITPQAAPVSTVIARAGVSISEKIELIKTLLREQPEVDFAELIRTARYRIEIIVTFLAVLEMIKADCLIVRQTELFGRIMLLPRPERQKTVEEASEPGDTTEP